MKKQLPGAGQHLQRDIPDNSGRGAMAPSTSTSALDKRPSQVSSGMVERRSEPPEENSVIPNSTGRKTTGTGMKPPEHIQYSLLNQPKDGGLPKQQIPKNLLPVSHSENSIGRRPSSSPNRNGGISMGSLFRFQDAQPQQILPSKLKESGGSGKKKKNK